VVVWTASSRGLIDGFDASTFNRAHRRPAVIVFANGSYNSGSEPSEFTWERILMQASTEMVDDVLLFSLARQINGNNAADLEQNLKTRVDQGLYRIVLDFSGVDYISSAGLRVVLWLAKQLREHAGALALYGLRKDVLEIFEMCGFVDFLTIVESREAALAKIKSA
jgi:stage II sporulation protein AA (anti-sigma F factor antagonist)